MPSVLPPVAETYNSNKTTVLQHGIRAIHTVSINGMAKKSHYSVYEPLFWPGADMIHSKTTLQLDQNQSNCFEI